MAKERCEHCDAPEGQRCPKWFDAERSMAWDLWIQNDVTKQKRPAVGCFYEIALLFLQSVGQNVLGAAVSVQSTRNVIAEGFGRVAETMIMLSPPANDRKLISGEAKSQQ